MRECGNCTLCCTVTYVPELNKTANIQCSNCNDGCTIYNERPNSCRGYRCEWLNGHLDEEMRPDISHVVIEKLPEVPIVLVLIEPGYENILNALIEPLSFYLDNGISVVHNRQVLLAPGKTEKDVANDVITASKSMGVI